jgi:hypothetical protein
MKVCSHTQSILSCILFRHFCPVERARHLVYHFWRDGRQCRDRRRCFHISFNGRRHAVRKTVITYTCNGVRFYKFLLIFTLITYALVFINMKQIIMVLKWNLLYWVIIKHFCLSYHFLPQCVFLTTLGKMAKRRGLKHHLTHILILYKN